MHSGHSWPSCLKVLPSNHVMKDMMTPLIRTLQVYVQGATSTRLIGLDAC